MCLHLRYHFRQVADWVEQTLVNTLIEMIFLMGERRENQNT